MLNLKDISKSTVCLLMSFPAENANKIINIALACLQPTSEDISKLIDKLSQETALPEDHVYEILGAYIKMLKLFVNSTDKDFNQSLLELGFTNQFLKNLPFTNNHKELIETYFMPSYKNFLNVKEIKWKLDISLQTSLLGDKILPNIILSLRLKDGRLCTVELNLMSFHKLRLNTALMIKDLSKLKDHSIVADTLK